MNKKATTITAMLLGIVAVSGTAFAFNGGFGSENREAIMNAIENGDYESWKTAITETLTEENFNRIREMHQNREAEMTAMQENRDAINQALEDSDYEAWKAAIEESGRTEILEFINEENFEKLVQIHEAEMNGDFETARELSQELGIPCGMGMFGGFGGRMGRRMGPMVPLEGE